jgi:membrane-bound lytic murein transglycosylase D
MQSPFPATSKMDNYKTTIISSLHGEQLRRPTGENGFNAAELRLNLLRPVVEPILRTHGVPIDLVAVILVESEGRATALSPKGARGLWQLMPDTARRFGLRVDETHDDRLDLFKSTDAAAQYLHDLYAQFGDWKLALAAYNAGEANVGIAILKAHTQDFNQLASLRMLPPETRNYVPRVLATAGLIGQSSTLASDRSPAGGATIFAGSNP